MQEPIPSLDTDKLRAAADQAQRLLKAMANPDRLVLLCRIIEDELSVGELETELGILQPTLSQQLGVLRREGLVETRREGKQIYYRIASPQALAVIDTLYRLYCSAEAG